MRATDLYRPWLFRGLGFLLGLCISAVSPSLLAEIPESISVQSGQTTHIAIDGLRRVVVGDGSVLGVKPLKVAGCSWPASAMVRQVCCSGETHSPQGESWFVSALAKSPGSPRTSAGPLAQMMGSP